MLPANSVASRQIVNGSVKSVDLKNGGVGSTDLKNGGVTGSDLAARSINRAGLFGTGNLGVVRAYAWNHSASANADLTSNGYTYNRSGGAVNVVHNAAGSYTVTFAGLNLDGGNVVVSGYGGSPTWCTVGGWSDAAVSVSCFDAAGSPADSQWTISISD